MREKRIKRKRDRIRYMVNILTNWHTRVSHPHTLYTYVIVAKCSDFINANIFMRI